MDVDATLYNRKTLLNWLRDGKEKTGGIDALPAQQRDKARQLNRRLRDRLARARRERGIGR